MNTTHNYLDKNTTDSKPFAVFFTNFGYYEGPFATAQEALAAARKAGFDSVVYRRTGEMVASWSAIGGSKRYTAHA